MEKFVVQPVCVASKAQCFSSAIIALAESKTYHPEGLSHTQVDFLEKYALHIAGGMENSKSFGYNLAELAAHAQWSAICISDMFDVLLLIFRKLSYVNPNNKLAAELLRLGFVYHVSNDLLLKYFCKFDHKLPAECIEWKSIAKCFSKISYLKLINKILHFSLSIYHELPAHTLRNELVSSLTYLYAKSLPYHNFSQFSLSSFGLLLDCVISMTLDALDKRSDDEIMFLSKFILAKSDDLRLSYGFGLHTLQDLRKKFQNIEKILPVMTETLSKYHPTVDCNGKFGIYQLAINIRRYGLKSGSWNHISLLEIVRNIPSNVFCAYLDLDYCPTSFEALVLHMATGIDLRTVFSNYLPFKISKKMVNSLIKNYHIVRFSEPDDQWMYIYLLSRSNNTIIVNYLMRFFNYNEFYNTFYFNFRGYSINYCFDVFNKVVDFYTANINQMNSVQFEMFASLLVLHLDKYPSFNLKKRNLDRLWNTLWDLYLGEIKLEIISLDNTNNLFSMGDKNYVFVELQSKEAFNHEGEIMHTCVARYYDYYCQGLTKVWSLRRLDNPNQPLATIEVKNNSVVQARGKRNSVLTGIERSLVVHWIRCNQFNISCFDLIAL